MALFLFLVCAAVAAVILAAGTAASGRVAGLAAADRQYYNATSAAELFREMMGGEKGVSTKIVSTKTTKLKRVNGALVPTGDEPVYEYSMGESSSSSDYVLTQRAAQVLLSGFTSAKEIWKWQSGETAVAASETNLGTFTIEHSGVSGLGDAADVLDKEYLGISIDVLANGDIVAQFAEKSAVKKNGDQPYKVQLTCKATTNTRTEERISIDDMEKTETKTTTITWVASDLKHVSSSS